MDAEIIWTASTQEDLTAAPISVKRTMGAALRTAQQGGMSADAQPMKGNLSDVVEIRDDDASGTYRLMYTTRIGDKIYVLDFFQKKSVSGIATPQRDLDRIHQRLKKAREHAAQQSKR